MSNILENMKKRLLHYINKNEESSFNKKLKLLAEEMEEIKTAFIDIDEVKNLKEAFGENLDNYGANIGENRKGNNDKLYRLLIRIKIAENTSNGSINHIVNALSLAIDKPLEEIYVQEGWDFIDEQQPASIFVSFPSQVFGNYNINYERFIELFNNVVGGGISTDFFVIEEDNIDVVATVPYTLFSSIPFCDTINTGQWTEQARSKIYKSILLQSYSTKPQHLPFAGALYSGDHQEQFNNMLEYIKNISFVSSRALYEKSFNYCNTFECGEVAV